MNPTDPRLTPQSASELRVEVPDAPIDSDRRAFMMRSDLIGAVAVLSGAPPASAQETAKKAATAKSPMSGMSPNLDVANLGKVL